MSKYALLIDQPERLERDFDSGNHASEDGLD
jgi:hypothetical protein